MPACMWLCVCTPCYSNVLVPFFLNGKFVLFVFFFTYCKFEVNNYGMLHDCYISYNKLIWLFDNQMHQLLHSFFILCFLIFHSRI